MVELLIADENESGNVLRQCRVSFVEGKLKVESTTALKEEGVAVSKEEPNKEETFIVLKYEIIYYNNESKNKIVIEKKRVIKAGDDIKITKEDLSKEKDEDFQITSIKFVKNDRESYDLLDEESKNYIFKTSKSEGDVEVFFEKEVEVELLKDSIGNILHRVSASEDYGLDTGLIYANILANTEAGKHENLLLYKTGNEFFKNCNCFNAINQRKDELTNARNKKLIKTLLTETSKKIENYKDTYSKELFKDDEVYKNLNEDGKNKFDSAIINYKKKIAEAKELKKKLTNEEKKSINEEIKPVKEYVISYVKNNLPLINDHLIVPNFSQDGHVFLSLPNIYGDPSNPNNTLSIDTQANSYTNGIIKSPLQTNFGGGGPCGFWVSEMAIELVNNKNKYKDIETNDKTLTELIINSASRVSKYIDGESIIKVSKKGEAQPLNFTKLYEVNDDNIYYINNKCGESKCVNIKGILALTNCGELKGEGDSQKKAEDAYSKEQEDLKKQTNTKTEKETVEQEELKKFVGNLNSVIGETKAKKEENKKKWKGH